MNHVIGFVLLLGILVFIHEFGHFYVAKLCGMKVEVFSIGMGKKILRFTRGETEYAISLFPLGGYVKILGQDPREEVSKHEEHRSFRNKKTWQKTAVVLAGPLANLLLAYVVLSFIYLKGAPTAAPVLARVLKDTPAYQAGLRSGDWITHIDNKKQAIEVTSLGDLQETLNANIGQDLELTAKRDSEILKLHATPTATLKAHPRLGVMQEQGDLSGVEYMAPAATVVAEHESWAAKYPVPYPFQITELEYTKAGQATKVEIADLFQLEREWSEAIKAQASERGQLILRGIPIVIPDDEKAPQKTPEIQEYSLVWTSANEAPDSSLKASGLSSTELLISHIVEGSPAASADIQKGDRIVALNDEAMVSFMVFKTRLQSLATEGKPITISWLRNGELMSKEVSTRVVALEDPITKVEKNQFQIGAAFLAIKAPPQFTTVVASGLIQAIKLGHERTVSLVTTMLESFYHLIVGNISLNTLGGPLTIAKVSGDSFAQGLVPFLQMMAFISLNLFILNLFPIPVLDGGHLILFAVEAIIRRPVGLKALEIWTTTGVVLLLMIMGVAFFNDFDRLGWIPSF